MVHNKLEVGDKLFCYDGISTMEVATVVSINKAEKTAVLDNQVVCSRKPNKHGLFKKVGYSKSEFVLHIMDDDCELLYKAKLARLSIQNLIYEINNKLLNRTGDILSSSKDDLETLIKLDNNIKRVLNKNN